MSDQHQHPNYMAIFYALVILTAVEFAIAIGLKGQHAIIIPALLALAFVKAGLVAAYFMHLKFERLLFVIIVTAPILLAVVLILGLMPDVGMMHR